MDSIRSIEAALKNLVKSMTEIRKKPKKATIEMRSEAETLSRHILGLATVHTINNGHSSRLDYVKDRTFEILGELIGEEL